MWYVHMWHIMQRMLYMVKSFKNIISVQKPVWRTSTSQNPSQKKTNLCTKRNILILKVSLSWFLKTFPTSTKPFRLLQNLRLPQKVFVGDVSTGKLGVNLNDSPSLALNSHASIVILPVNV